MSRRDLRQKSRPYWIADLDAVIRYWLKNTSRRRHGAPFNKTPVGKARRDEKRFKQKGKEAIYARAEPNTCLDKGWHGLDRG